MSALGSVTNYMTTGLNLLSFYYDPTSESGVKSGIKLLALPGLFAGAVSTVAIVEFGRKRSWVGNKGTLRPWVDGLLTTAIGAALSYTVTAIVSRILLPAFVPEPVRHAFRVSGLVGSIFLGGARAVVFIATGKDPTSPNNR